MDAFAGRLTGHFENALRSPASETELRKIVCDTLLTADRWGHARRDEFFREVAERLPWATRVSPEVIRAFWARHFAECAQPAIDLHDTLRSLRARGIRLGVVSNGRGDMQQWKLDVLGVRDELSCVVISGVLGVQKPDARIFHHAMSVLEVAPQACWFVGDHPLHDVAGARGAGMTAVWVDHGQPWPAGQLSPTLRIKRLGDLVALIA
jgi:putative hydrolase of the HAD superfamily